MSLPFEHALLRFIRLDDKPLVEWLIQRAGDPPMPLQKGPLAECAEQLQTLPVILLVPSTELLLTSATVPIQAKHQLRQALRFALEESCSEDIEQLHIALAPAPPLANRYPLAVISHQLMKGWLALLRDAGINLQHMVADCMTLPYLPDTMTIVINEHYAVVRHHEWQGFAVEQDNLDKLLLTTLQNTTPLPKEIRLVTVTNSNIPALASTQSWLEKQARSFHINPESISFLHYAAKHISLPVWDLLQPPYRNKPLQQHSRYWLGAGIIASLSLMVALGGEGYQYFQLRQQQQALQQEINGLYKQVFPNATHVNSPRVLIQRELDKRTTTAASQPLFALLYSVGSALKEMPELKLMGITYEKQQMAIELQAAMPDSLQEFIAAIEARGLKVQQKNSEQQKDIASVVLLIGVPQ